MTEAAHEVFMPDRLYGIIGHPLGHSLSPLVHNWGFHVLGLNAVYARWPQPSSALANFLQAVRILPISGLSVTIPHKQGVLAFLDECTPRAERCGAVNTIFWKEGRLCGENTDISGFLTPLEGQGADRIRSALVLGCGGAARAVLAALAELGVKESSVSGRSCEKTVALAREFNAMSVAWENRGDWRGDLLVNATPLGMSGSFSGLNPWPETASWAGVGCVYDLVYTPLETNLLREARARDVFCVSGLEMFLGQARAQFRLWTGMDLPLAPLRQLVTSVLA